MLADTDRIALTSRVAITALACVLAPAWLVSNHEELFWPLQGLLVAVGLAAAVVVLGLAPRILRMRRLDPAEWLLGGFLLIGVIGALRAPAPLGRLAGPIVWLEAVTLIVLLARLASAVVVRQVLLTYCGLSVVAAVFFVYGQRPHSIPLPFLIYPNHFALLLVLPTCILASEVLDARGLRRWISLAAFCVLVAALALAKSRAVIVGFAVAAGGAVIYGFYRSVMRGNAVTFALKISGLAALVVVMLVVLELNRRANGDGGLYAAFHTLLYPDEGSFGGRLRRWQNALPLILTHPVFGSGFGSWYPSFAAYRHSITADSAGNASALSTYVLLAAETGLAGLMSFLGFCLLVLVRPIRQAAQAPIRIALGVWLVALLFHSVSDFPLVLGGFAFVAGMALWREPASERPQSFRRSHWLALSAIALVLVAAHGRYALSSMETRFLRDVLHGSGHPTRLLWRVLAPVSSVIDPTVSHDEFLARADGLESSLRWSLPGPRDPHVYIAFALDQRGERARSEAWYQRAIDREPDNVRALDEACRVDLERGLLQQARALCQRALSFNAMQPESLETLARIDLVERKLPDAVRRLSAARRAWWQRLDLNDFGSWTLGTVSSHYASYRRVSDLRATLVQGRPTLLGDVNEEIEQTPLLHSVIAPWGCKVYFSANINARYNVWLADACNPAVSPRLITDDSLTPYQLQATGAGLYFISDRRGNSIYDLYFIRHGATTINRVALPAGRLAEYEINRESDDAAVVMFAGRHYTLFVGTPRAGFREIYTARSPIGGLAWNPKQRALLFTVAGRLMRWSSKQPVPDTIVESDDIEIGKPSFAPGGARVAVPVRTGQTTSNISVCDLQSRICRAVVSTEHSIALSPVWVSESEIVFRDVAQDEYLLRRLSLGDGSVTPIGTTQGVVYPMIVDGSTGTLWFCAATQTAPMHIASIARGSDEAVTRVRLDWIEPSQVLPAVRSDLDGSTVYTIYPPTGEGREAIVWLHGGGSSFSPRWNSIAQDFAYHGYRFVALNYAVPWSPGSETTDDWSTQAAQVEALVERLRSQGVVDVHLVGVSTGTKVLQAVLRRGNADVASAIEFSPVRNEVWNKPQLLPPMLIVTGANDPLLGLNERKRQIEAQRDIGSSIQLLVMHGEGHELRGRAAIESRMAATFAFLHDHGESKRVTSTD